MIRLRLAKETLTELSGEELRALAGGTHLGCGATDGCGHGESFDADCPTLPVNLCLTTPRGTCNCFVTS